MPTYHYRCAKCEQHLEVVQSMTDDPITTCAACGGNMQKVLQPVGIVLKGSGFYRTDSRSSGKKAKGESSGGSEKGDAKKSDAKKSDTPKDAKSDSSAKSSTNTSARGGTADAKSA